MNRLLILLALLSLMPHSFALTFKDAIQSLQKHESIESITSKSAAMSEEAKNKGSWGDPKFMIAARNFPKDSFKKDETAMTGIEFGISQKIALTTKYGNMEDALESMSRAYKYEADDKRQALVKGLWEILIIKRKITEELIILNENMAWITKILSVSKKLYANGKVSQQAILEIQIRSSEIESLISNKNFELAQLGDKLTYLIGASDVEAASIPWKLINVQSKKDLIDNKELVIKEKLKSKDLSLSAAQLNYIPDLTFSLGVTKRANIDNKGDFVGASVSFPLPFSGEKYSNHDKAIHEKYSVVRKYENYKKSKIRDVSILEKEIQKIISEIKIIDSKTIKFASNSREITSKSYGLGSSTYMELLQSELKLQKILMQKIMLETQRDIKKIALKYTLGEVLYE